MAVWMQFFRIRLFKNGYSLMTVNEDAIKLRSRSNLRSNNYMFENIWLKNDALKWSIKSI